MDIAPPPVDARILLRLRPKHRQQRDRPEPLR